MVEMRSLIRVEMRFLNCFAHASIEPLYAFRVACTWSFSCALFCLATLDYVSCFKFVCLPSLTVLLCPDFVKLFIKLHDRDSPETQLGMLQQVCNLSSSSCSSILLFFQLGPVVDQVVKPQFWFATMTHADAMIAVGLRKSGLLLIFETFVPISLSSQVNVRLISPSLRSSLAMTSCLFCAPDSR